MKSIQFLLITALYSLSTLSVQQITDMAFFNNKVLSGNAVIMFTTPTCGPCQLIKPVYQSQSSTQASLYLVNVDASNPASATLANKFNVRSYPTFLFLRNGKEVKRFITGEAGFQQKFNNAMQEAFSGGASRVSTPLPQKPSPPHRRKSKRQRPCGKKCKCPTNKPGNTCCDCGPNTCQC